VIDATDVFAGEVVSFWRDAGPDKWYKKDAAFVLKSLGRFKAAEN
jgi:uncharacterized protein (DUF924 family)